MNTSKTKTYLLIAIFITYGLAIYCSGGVYGSSRYQVSSDSLQVVITSEGTVDGWRGLVYRSGDSITTWSRVDTIEDTTRIYYKEDYQVSPESGFVFIGREMLTQTDLPEYVVQWETVPVLTEILGPPTVVEGLLPNDAEIVALHEVQSTEYSPRMIFCLVLFVKNIPPPANRTLSTSELHFWVISGEVGTKGVVLAKWKWDSYLRTLPLVFEILEESIQEQYERVYIEYVIVSAKYSHIAEILRLDWKQSGRDKR